MSIRIIRKALSLLVVDIVIIIGIFVLQFRTDSSIIQKIGNLQLAFSQVENKEKELILQNKGRISYNGINFFFDDQTPAIIRNKNSEISPVSLVSYEQKDNLSYILNFSEGVKVTFELASEDLNSSLAIIADLPSGIQDFALPYNFSSNMRILKNDGNRFVLNNKKTSWEVSAFSLESGYFDLNRRDYIATYSIYDETQKFSFDTVVNLDIADSLVFEENMVKFKDSLISSYKSNSSESNISEQVIVSYLAAQLEKGNYIQALDDIPANLKKGRQRTYLSAPYLNTLEEMNKLLEASMADYEFKISESANSGSLDIFTVHDIANFMCIHSKPADVAKLLQNAAAADITKASLAQATGILSVYDALSGLNPSFAVLLEPVVEACVERITESCSFENNVLTISENDTFLSVIQAVETGVAIMRYGYITGNVTLQKAGYVLVNSYMSDSSSYDLRTLANLYPIFAYNNKFYPHFEKITSSDGTVMWAWTCARSIKCDKDADGSLTFTIDFPETYTHYIIIKGVPQFSSIYIYNMAFRTDPRFETYNSSGYVYKTGTKTLLLKSRHKTRFETVRLEYRDKAASASTVQTPSSASSSSTPAETTAVSTENPAPAASLAAPAPAAETKPKTEETPAATTPAETPASPAAETSSEVKPETKETAESSETSDSENKPAETSENKTAETSETPAANTTSRWRRRSSNNN